MKYLFFLTLSQVGTRDKSPSSQLSPCLLKLLSCAVEYWKVFRWVYSDSKCLGLELISKEQ